ncbi:MAG: hypothetical protein ABIK09_00700 [Pseudomonadota bacterium]
MRQLAQIIAFLCLLSLGCDPGDPAPESESGPDSVGPADPCPVPQGPCLPVLHLGASLPFHAGGLPLEVGVGAGLDAASPAAWTAGASLTLDTLGPQVLFARVAACAAPQFACATDVREAYPGAAGTPGSDAVSADDPAISAWAAAAVSYEAGEGVDEAWTDPQQAAGPAEGSATDILCLGRGGAVVLSFADPFADGPGPDLAVFENSFSATFLELAFVEVSTDGEAFARFDSISLTPAPVPPYGTMDPARISGLAGTVGKGLGTPFDLAALGNHPGVLGGAISLDAIHFVRIVDVVGDGGTSDSLGNPIYDPYPTAGSAGFDLDAVAVLGD